MPQAHDGSLTPGEVAALLQDARERTLLLVAPVPEDELMNQHNRLMSPVVWDMGHIAHFEELWLVRNLEGPVQFGEMPGIFNPFENPRSVRGELALPRLADTLDHMACARRMVLDRVVAGDTGAADPQLLAGRLRLPHGGAARVPAQRDHPAGAAAQGRRRALPCPARHRPPRRPARRGGRGRHGALSRRHAWRSAPTTAPPRTTTSARATPWSSPPSASARGPVTNGEYARFIADGGYDAQSLWSEAGWKHREEADLAAPQFWEMRDGQWWTRSMDAETPVDPDRPVCHVCWYEAEAYCRWAGGRLPTEQEWEAAASWDPATGSKRAYPWGDEAPGAAGRQPGPARLPDGADRRLSAQRLPHRRVRDDRRRVGVDGVGLRAPGRGTRRFRIPSTASSSSGRTTRCCAAGRGPRARAPSATPSATGTTPSAGRSSADSGWRAMTDCIHDVPAAAADPAAVREVAEGLSRPPKELPPTLLLRRARLAALRGDHPAPRVLPDADRTVSPAAVDAGVDRRTGARARWWSWAPAARKRRASCSMPSPPRSRVRRLRAGGRERGVPGRRRRSASAPAYPSIDVVPLVADITDAFALPDGLPATHAARLSRQHHRQLRAGARRSGCCGACAGGCERRPVPDGRGPAQGPRGHRGRVQRRGGGYGGVQPQHAARA